jgi:uncharacterized membrane protein YeiB
MDVLDVMRGIAVLGILLVNIDAFAGYGFLSPEESAAAQHRRHRHFLMGSDSDGTATYR